MLETFVEYALGFVAVYLGLGLLFAAVFHRAGLRRVDPAVTGAGWQFRCLITPGLAVLWPLMALRWIRSGTAPVPDAKHDSKISPRRLRAMHGLAVKVLAILLPATLAFALIQRPPGAPAVASIPSLQGEPAPLPISLSEPVQLFPNLPIHARTLKAPDGRRQLELSIPRDLEEPALALYWSPAPVADSLPLEAVFLGLVWGPGVRHYSLPRIERGHFVLYSLARTGGVLASVPIPREWISP